MTQEAGKDGLLPCPFCKETDYDLVGLKAHMSSGDCDQYNSTEDILGPILRHFARPTPQPSEAVRLGLESLIDMREWFQAQHGGNQLDFAQNSIAGKSFKRLNKAIESLTTLKEAGK